MLKIAMTALLFGVIAGLAAGGAGTTDHETAAGILGAIGVCLLIVAIVCAIIKLWLI